MADLPDSSRQGLYVYQSLDKSTRKIRLLQLTRNVTLNDIECKLPDWSLDEAPGYDAISYTWGNPAETHGIIVNGKWLPTSANVWEIVQKLAPQENTGCVYIWIDFICINQKNNDEKNWQVDMMGKIYESAKQVVVFLGDSPNGDADLAIEQVEYLRSQLEEKKENVEDFRAQVDGPEFGNASPKWDAFNTLVNHKFWTRVWIVQEVALARKLRIVYGGKELSWEGFATVMEAFKNIDNDGPLGIPKMVAGRPKEGLPFLGVARILLVAKIRKMVRDAETITLRDMLEHSSKFAATNPRDHIFALEGLVTDKETIDPHLRPDYGKTVADIFKITTRHYLQQENGLWILELAGIGYKRNIGDLPSWVADLSCDRRMASDSETTDPLVSMLALLGITPAIATVRLPTISYPPETISMHGIIATQISRVSTLALMTNSQPGLGSLLSLGAFLQMRSMAMTVFPIQYNATGEDCREAFWRTLVQTTETDEFADMLRLCYAGLDGGLALFQTVTERMLLNPEESVQASIPGVQDDLASLMFLATRFFMAVGVRSGGERFAILNGGYMAMVPPGAKQGDVLVLVRGEKPFLFRKSYMQGKYQLVGKCYVHGLTAAKLANEGKKGESIEIC
ncbi:heterokaryon incompatibility protein-domain-containing protein [Cadophora sp. MPI-SDFR-AT-0126]|nr:heterokaryon incompatibility protein-domain-containing protein [Leotiomycetes sp. MPI-SDFR-AT-0126]